MRPPPCIRLPSTSHRFLLPVDRMGTAARPCSGTVTAKGKKGMLRFMPDLLNSNKRSEISTPYDPVHLTRVGFNSSTGGFSGLPKEWQQHLHDSGISKSRILLPSWRPSSSIRKVVAMFGIRWATPRPQRGLSITTCPGHGLTRPPGVPQSVDDSVVHTVSPFLHISSGALADSSKRPSLSL